MIGNCITLFGFILVLHFSDAKSKPLVLAPVGVKFCQFVCCIFNCRSFNFHIEHLTCFMFREVNGAYTMSSTETCKETMDEKLWGKCPKCKPFHVTVCGHKPTCIKTSVRTSERVYNPNRNTNAMILLSRAKSCTSYIYSVAKQRPVQTLLTKEAVIGAAFDTKTKDLYLGTSTHLLFYAFRGNRHPHEPTQMFSFPVPLEAIAIAGKERLMFMSGCGKPYKAKLPFAPFQVQPERRRSKISCITVIQNTQSIMYVDRYLSTTIYEDNFNLQNKKLVCTISGNIVKIDVTGNLYYVGSKYRRDIKKGNCLMKWSPPSETSFSVLPINTGAVYTFYNKRHLLFTNSLGIKIAEVTVKHPRMLPLAYWIKKFPRSH